MIMSISAFVCFLGVVVLMADTVQPLWGRTMLLLLPAAILCVVGKVWKKNAKAADLPDPAEEILR